MSNFDLVVRWPKEAGEVAQIVARYEFPLARTPKWINLSDGKVWIASAGQLVGHFRTRGWTVQTRQKMLDGDTVDNVGAGRLQLQPGTATVLKRPINMSSIPGGTANPFGHKYGLRCMKRAPRAFVVLTKKSPVGPSKGPVETELPITSKQLWLQQTRDQAGHTAEGIKHATEARLVEEFSAHRAIVSGHQMVRLRIPTSDGSQLLSDAFDKHKNLLIEAKGDTSRPAVRMAIGQVLDYCLLVRPKRPGAAILLPAMPADDLITLAHSVGIGVIWRLPPGGFDDSRRGLLVD